MKLSDVKLLESISFNVSKTEPHEKYGTVHSAVGKMGIVPCRFCDGTGKEKWGDEEYECGYCDGKGETSDFIPEGPEMNLSNRNAEVFLKLLGVEFDYAGTIFNEELPQLRRRIVKVLNSNDISSATIDPYERGGELRRDKVKSDDGTTQIATRRTPKMIDFGLPESQIKRYFRDFLEMIDFAQKNGYNIGWG